MKRLLRVMAPSHSCMLLGVAVIYQTSAVRHTSLESEFNIDTSLGFKCPRECQPCCQVPTESGFECRLKPVMRRTATWLKAIANGAYKCHLYNKDEGMQSIYCTSHPDSASGQSEGSDDNTDRAEAELKGEVDSIKSHLANAEKTLEQINGDVSDAQKQLAQMKEDKASPWDTVKKMEKEIEELKNQAGAKGSASLLQLASVEPGRPKPFKDGPPEKCVPFTDKQHLTATTNSGEVVALRSEVKRLNDELKSTKAKIADAKKTLDSVKSEQEAVVREKGHEKALAKIKSLEKHKGILKQFLDSGLLTLRDELQTFEQVAASAPKVASVILKLRAVGDGTNGPSQKETYDAYIATHENGSTLHADTVRLTKFCKEISSESCDDTVIAGFFTKLAEEASQAEKTMDAEIASASKGEEVSPDALKSTEDLKAKKAKLGDIFELWNDKLVAKYTDLLNIVNLFETVNENIKLAEADLQEAKVKTAEEEEKRKEFDAKVKDMDEQIRVFEENKQKQDEVIAQLNEEIDALEQKLKDGVPPKNPLSLFQSAFLQLDVNETVGAKSSQEKSRDDVSPDEGLEKMQEALIKTKKDVASAQAALEEKRSDVKRLQEALAQKEAELKKRQNDPEYLNIKKTIEGLEAKKEKTQAFIDEGYAAMRYEGLQLDIAARRSPEIARLLLRLWESKSGRAGKDRKKAFDEYVAIDEGSEDRMNSDYADLETFCKAVCGSAQLMSREKLCEDDQAFPCTDTKIDQFFDELKDKVIEATKTIKTEIDQFLEGKDPVAREGRKQKVFIDDMMMLVGSLIKSWQLTDPPRFNEHLWMTYLNWVEDTESAVRVYIKVTNRERVEDNPDGVSNGLLTCSEQQPNLPYIPDRMVRIEDCSKEPKWEADWASATEACKDHDEWDQANEENTYGPFFGVYASSDNKSWNDFDHNVKNTDVYGYEKKPEESYDWAPHMRNVVRQARSGYTVVLFGYGYSGSGKTYTLLGHKKTPGVMTLGLEEMQDDIVKIRIRFKEIYGQMSLEDGRPEIGETGIFSYKLAEDEIGMPKCQGDSEANCVEHLFWGREDSDTATPATWEPEDIVVKNGNFVNHLEREDHTMVIDKDRLAQAGKTIGEWIQEALDLIQLTRAEMSCRNEYNRGNAKGCSHVRSTPNNPQSSRGHLFTILDVTFRALDADETHTETVGKIVIVDCAGSEDPVSIMKDYVDFGYTYSERDQKKGYDQQKKESKNDRDVADKRAARYLKRYDEMRGKKFSLWQNQEYDQVVPYMQMYEWQLEAAEDWFRDISQELTEEDKKMYKVVKDDCEAEGHISRGNLPWNPKAKKKDRKYREWAMETWATRYLRDGGVIATVKEGVFINESLNHLKQFLLRRAGKVKSLVQVLGDGAVKMIEDEKTLIPGVKVDAPMNATNVKDLPLLNTWDYDTGNPKDDKPAAKVSPFSGWGASKTANDVYDPRASFYHPKQFIKPWNSRVVTNKDGGSKKYRDAFNSGSFISSARCAIGWPTKGDDPEEPDFDCDKVTVDGVQLKKSFLTNGEIPRFDPMLITSMLNYFDHPEHFRGGDANSKPTKFLMMAAIRREHPESHSNPPAGKPMDEHAFHRLKFNICKGSMMTLNFADEMNPLSKKFQVDEE